MGKAYREMSKKIRQRMKKAVAHQLTADKREIKDLPKLPSSTLLSPKSKPNPSAPYSLGRDKIP